jgi:hypothetical protein
MLPFRHGSMSDNIYVPYLGFESKGSVREYIFCVREAPSGPREFILTIANESFRLAPGALSGCARVEAQQII